MRTDLGYKRGELEFAPVDCLEKGHVESVNSREEKYRKIYKALVCQFHVSRFLRGVDNVSMIISVNEAGSIMILN
jgi:hypothetical protein